MNRPDMRSETKCRNCKYGIPEKTGRIWCRRKARINSPLWSCSQGTPKEEIRRKKREALLHVTPKF